LLTFVVFLDNFNILTVYKNVFGYNSNGNNGGDFGWSHNN